MDNVPYGDIRFELRSGEYQLTVLPECAYISHKGKAQKLDHDELLKRLWDHPNNGWCDPCNTRDCDTCEIGGCDHGIRVD